MIINYMLLAVTGIYSVITIINLIRGGGFTSNKMFQEVFVFLVFILVLIATLMGMDYASFKYMIESWF